MSTAPIRRATLRGRDDSRPLLAALGAGGRALLLAAAPGAAAREQAPVQIAPSQTIDVGDVDPTSFARARFQLRNPTRTVLEVDEYRVTCNCTRVRSATMTIPPGGVLDVDVSIDLRGDVGDMTKRVNVHFADYEDPTVLVVEGRLQYAITADPPRIRAQSSMAGTVTLSSSDGRPFRIHSVDGEAPVVVSQVPRDGDRFLRATIRYDRRADLTRSALVIVTDHPKARVIPLRVLDGNVSGEEMPYIRQIQQLAVSHKLVNLGALEPGESIDVMTTIYRDEKYHADPLRVGFDDMDGLEVEVLAIEDQVFPRGQTVKMRITSEIDEPRTILTPLYFRFDGDEGEVTFRVWAAAYADAPTGDEG